MGGIATDARGRTSLPGLWAAGEVASTGLHGANRLASNSLLEAVVIGARVATDIQRLVPVARAQRLARLMPVKSGRPIDPVHRAREIELLRRTMTDHVGVWRTAAGLTKALGVLARIEADAGEDTVLANMALAARIVTTAAMMRCESRGGHYRMDFPEADPGLAKRSFLSLADLAPLPRRVRQRAATNPVHRALP